MRDGPTLCSGSVSVLRLEQCPSNETNLLEYMTRASPNADSAVAVTGPLDRELHDPISMVDGADDDFNVEHESLRQALCVQPPCNIRSVEFETALSVGEMAGKTHPPYNYLLKKSGHDLSIPVLFFAHDTPR